MNSKISQAEIPLGEMVNAKDIREGIFNFIKSNHPDFTRNDTISLTELNHYRRLFLTTLISQENGELTSINLEVMNAIKSNSLLSENFQDDKENELTIGQKIADKIAEFGGSWTFIICFLVFIIIWIVVNLWTLIFNSFDPYPFILLNLILSCIAAIQAPIIIMSQNRQEQKDRNRSEQDYKINLKAELEIKLLSEKIDQLIVNQNNKLLEIQKIHTDYLEDLVKR